MDPLAHIGNIPVEEWLPFLVPVLALYLYGRRANRRRREAVSRLPGPGAPLQAGATARVLAAWAGADHAELTAEHLLLLYPPGPDGASAAELAQRSHVSLATVQRLLDDLRELGYLDVEELDQAGQRRAWLTDQGSELVELTEDALLEHAATAAHEPAGGG